MNVPPQEEVVMNDSMKSKLMAEAKKAEDQKAAPPASPSTEDQVEEIDQFARIEQLEMANRQLKKDHERTIHEQDRAFNERFNRLEQNMIPQEEPAREPVFAEDESMDPDLRKVQSNLMAAMEAQFRRIDERNQTTAAQRQMADQQEKQKSFEGDFQAHVQEKISDDPAFSELGHYKEYVHIAIARDVSQDSRFPRYFEENRWKELVDEHLEEHKRQTSADLTAQKTTEARRSAKHQGKMPPLPPSPTGGATMPPGAVPAQEDNFNWKIPGQRRSRAVEVLEDMASEA